MPLGPGNISVLDVEERGGVCWAKMLGRALLAKLHRGGVEIDPKIKNPEFGYFRWTMEPEGNKIELWEPPVADAT